MIFDSLHYKCIENCRHTHEPWYWYDSNTELDEKTYVRSAYTALPPEACPGMMHLFLVIFSLRAMRVLLVEVVPSRERAKWRMLRSKLRGRSLAEG